MPKPPAPPLSRTLPLRQAQDKQKAVTVAKRKTPRQATSAVAHAGSEPEDDDPLLAFAPYLHPAPRSNSITPERQRRFVATLAATGIVNQAARSIGKSVEALYKLRARPGAEGFAVAWDAALERGVGRLEDCALERALKGTATPIVSHGQILGWWDKPDNALLRFLLQHRLPERYGVQTLAPGHPVYESIRAGVEAETEARRAAEAKELRAEIARLRRETDRMQGRAEIAEWKLEDLQAERAADAAEGGGGGASGPAARPTASTYHPSEEFLDALERDLYRGG